MVKCSQCFVYSFHPGGDPQIKARNATECSPFPVIILTGGTNKELLKGKGYLKQSKIGLLRLKEVWTGRGDDLLTAFTFYSK